MCLGKGQVLLRERISGVNISDTGKKYDPTKKTVLFGNTILQEGKKNVR